MGKLGCLKCSIQLQPDKRTTTSNSDLMERVGVRRRYVRDEDDEVIGCCRERVSLQGCVMLSKQGGTASSYSLSSADPAVGISFVSPPLKSAQPAVGLRLSTSLYPAILWLNYFSIRILAMYKMSC